MKLAEALILRKQLVQKIAELRPLKDQADSGYFKDTVSRIRVHDPVPTSTNAETAGGTDEITEQKCLIDPDTIYKSWDEHCTSLRKLDAAIQQANWKHDIENVKLPKGLE